MLGLVQYSNPHCDLITSSAQVLGALDSDHVTSEPTATATMSKAKGRGQ
jgi:hypothetical protein